MQNGSVVRNWFRASLVTCLLIMFGSFSAAQSFDDLLAGGPGGLAAQEPSFLPVEEAYQLLASEQEAGRVRLQWSIADTYYLYRHAFKVDLHTADGKVPGEMDIVPGKAKTDEYFGDVEVYYFNAELSFAVPDGVSAFSVRSQGCADAGLCYPPRTQHFLRTAAGFEEVGELPELSEPSVSASSQLQGSAQAPGLLSMLLFAFLGGALLNLMPCVFPVLALKVLSLTQAGQNPSEQRRQAIAYTAGVVLSFLLVAGALLALRGAGEALGWGFQLQSPWVVAALVYVFFVLALSLAGFLELGASWAGAGQGLTEQSGSRGSFFTGVLAVVVASPCTAPFMGTAMGFALLQPSAIALLIFAALGVGMAAPFLVLVVFPALAAYLPRPGVWMVRFKEFMAIPLLATCVYLLWVLGQQAGAEGMAAVGLGLVLIYSALWFWQGASVLQRSVAAACLAAALVLPFSDWLEPRKADANSQFDRFSNARVEELRAQGKPVFVNATAAWCITCLANERTTLSRPSVQQAFREAGVAYLKADWTNSDPAITALLNDFGRSGVPLYVLYPKDASMPATVLPQVLTPDLVIKAVESL